MGKHKHYKFMGFSNILGEANPLKSQNKGKVIPIVREKYGKTQTFQSYEFLKFFV